MGNFMDDYFTTGFMQGLQNFVIALIVLLVGWLLAKAIGNAVEKALRKTQIDDRFFNKFRTNDKPVNSEKIFGKVVYYILLLIVFVLFFNVLNMNMIANPLSNLVATIFGVIPAVLKAVLILALAWIIASIVQWLIVHGTQKLNLLHLFYKMKLAKTEEEIKSYIERLGKVAFYLILLLFIPGVLDALNIAGVAQPFSGLLATMLAFIPKLLAAAIIFAVGWFVAKVVKNIVVNLLQVVGVERLIGRLKLNKAVEGTSFAGFVGNVVFILIMIPITIAALEKLDLTGITGPAIGMLHNIMNMIPNILIGIALILAGVWLGKLIGEFVRSYLQNVGFDRLTKKMNVSNSEASQQKMAPSALVGYIVQVLITFFLTVQALYLVQLDFLVVIATAVTAYLPQVLAAVLILAIALIIANIVEKVLRNVLTGPATIVLAGFAKYTVIVLAVFMALTQLGIATTIVSSAFILILGGLSLAFGLAFGLGGKDFARKYLKKFDQTIEETKMKEKKSKADVTENIDLTTDPVEYDSNDFNTDDVLKSNDLFENDTDPDNDR
ncbi:mechanosensitive ion channel [Virgibacillus sp. C22-A2]|uniref:Mechanosensitive ion channel n=1 Tax=Virgibacillus tibetensis TaxID=3042313 RepID=A0ABU6KHS9_9BACI|nr:mechanosensitive ion channel [Virgibacillus sp. C22-A2]